MFPRFQAVQEMFAALQELRGIVVEGAEEPVGGVGARGETPFQNGTVDAVTDLPPAAAAVRVCRLHIAVNGQHAQDAVHEGVVILLAELLRPARGCGVLQGLRPEFPSEGGAVGDVNQAGVFAADF